MGSCFPAVFGGNRGSKPWVVTRKRNLVGLYTRSFEVPASEFRHRFTSGLGIVLGTLPEFRPKEKGPKPLGFTSLA